MDENAAKHQHHMEELLAKAIDAYGLSGVHPAANLFPFVDKEDFDFLVKDVQEKGFLNPGKVTNDGLLLDGRNRICASIEVGVDLRLMTYNPKDPTSYVISENLARRHLSAGQRAMIALELERIYAEEAKKRQVRTTTNRLKASASADPLVVVNLPQQENAPPEPKSRDKAATAMGTSGSNVQRAKKIQAVAPALADEVKSGTKTLNQAYSEAKAIEKAMPKPEPVEPAKPDLILTNPESQDWDECIETEHGKIYVLHRPNSKPTLNRTNESVDWAQWTWNPVTGCHHGCNYCYAREIANSDRMASAYPYKFDPVFHPSRLTAPIRQKPPQDNSDPRSQNIFACSMADLFGRWVPTEWILQVFDIVDQCPEWNFLFLTKFPQRLKEINDTLEGFPDNAWMGTTVDTQARVRVAEKAFSQIQAKVKWLSCEPLLEDLNFNSLDMFNWVVIGGQSASYFNGTPAVQPEWEWVENLWNQSRFSGCKIYWKENLTVRPKETPWT